MRDYQLPSGKVPALVAMRRLWAHGPAQLPDFRQLAPSQGSGAPTQCRARANVVRENRWMISTPGSRFTSHLDSPTFLFKPVLVTPHRQERINHTRRNRTIRTIETNTASTPFECLPSNATVPGPLTAQSPTNQVTWQVAFALVPLALGTMTQPAGRLLDRPLEQRF